ncbi:hypothetical protein B4U37_01715 [Sutcliffiella horikoshii]|uniref:Uncharacterized protein n=1 Tax=Sutcliffiella horikoshii TaxID=79883 RepID=A0ABN4Z902_9BACI|nr:hypothetical protein [Sutcliffiella horikoshii]ART74842.1 hypothetical protein B4U37_01715 [Sutcliffiella horikoshii]
MHKKMIPPPLQLHTFLKFITPNTLGAVREFFATYEDRVFLKEGADRNGNLELVFAGIEKDRYAVNYLTIKFLYRREGKDVCLVDYRTGEKEVKIVIANAIERKTSKTWWEHYRRISTWYLDPELSNKKITQNFRI